MINDEIFWRISIVASTVGFLPIKKGSIPLCATSAEHNGSIEQLAGSPEVNLVSTELLGSSPSTSPAQAMFTV